MKEKKCSAPDDFAVLVDQALDTYKTNPHLPVYKGLVLASQGRKEEALEHYKSLLRRWPKKFFLWSKAEELVPYKNLDVRIGMLCRAMSVVRDPAFLGDIRLRLANLLYKRGLYAYARYELEEYIRSYTSQGWKIKRWCDIILERLASTAPNISAEPTPYSYFLPFADKFINGM